VKSVVRKIEVMGHDHRIKLFCNMNVRGLRSHCHHLKQVEGNNDNYET
jgi:hypothetical protein